MFTVDKQWELTSKTCGDHNNTETINPDGSTTTLASLNVSYKYINMG